ncbi:MAG TPA: choice-of-anchor D domain-containing protein, partial [Candidatus Kapabacteria bacterium]|nr:choice-of-anchor D domain-containing protein [Candidatus Kapabacteria bacterium]
GGGGGSGGAISIGARDSIVIGSTSAMTENGGSAGSGQNNGGNGGTGRARLNGMVSTFASPSSTNYFSTAKDFTGPSIQRVTSTPDTVLVHGYAEQWDGVPNSTLPIEVRWAWPSSPVWHDTLAGIFVDPKSHTAQWSALLPNSTNPMDSEVYIVAVQDESGSSTTYANIPSAVMSHTSGIIAKVVGQPKMLVKVTSINFGNVLVDSCSDDTTIEIYSIGRGNLIVDSAALNPAISDFKIKTIFKDTTLPPGDSLSLTLSFCPDTVMCPIAAMLGIYSNGGDTAVSLTGCGIQPHAILNPDTLNFGRVHLGDCKDTFALVTNTGTSALEITQESIGDPVHFKILDPLPMIVPPGSTAELHLEFCPSDTNSISTVDTIVNNAPESPNLLTLIGSGKIGVLSLPAVLDF